METTEPKREYSNIPFIVMGDTHYTWDSKKIDDLQIKLQNTKTSLDYLIIAGDFGFVWKQTLNRKISANDMYAIDAYFSRRPWITLFVPGNHENYDVLDKIPRSTKWGGSVAEIFKNKVYMLDKGEVYTILGKKILACGGAKSIDKQYRIPNYSWWPQEEFIEKDYLNACKNLDACNWSVDFVVSHTCPKNVYNSFKASLPDMYPEAYWEEKLHDGSTDYLQRLADKLVFKSWYFGHFHEDIKLPDVDGKYYEMLYKTWTEPKV